ncbi:hypothetical protein Droror1_Dr00020065 [Drosera rotundifolia]
MQIKTGRYHTLLLNNSSVYSCGSSLCGVLGHGPETTQCVAFNRFIFPSSAPVVQVSASHNHAAFVTQFGEFFTCGDNASCCCGQQDTGRLLFRPKLVEALHGILCKQVATGLSFTMFLTREGSVYTCGANTHGQLGHGDTVDRPTPKIIVALGDPFKRKGVHVVHVSAGDEHVVALDSSGYVYTWGKDYLGVLGHDDEVDKTIPSFFPPLQVCASKRKTFVLSDAGRVYGFGWMGFGSLGFPDKGASDKITRPRVLDSLWGRHIAQVSTGLYHTVVITNRGKIFGFGDNERAQLGHDSLRCCPRPTEIFIEDTTDQSGVVQESA